MQKKSNAIISSGSEGAVDALSELEPIPGTDKAIQIDRSLAQVREMLSLSTDLLSALGGDYKRIGTILEDMQVELDACENFGGKSALFPESPAGIDPGSLQLVEQLLEDEATMQNTQSNQEPSAQEVGFLPAESDE